MPELHGAPEEYLRSLVEIAGFATEIRENPNIYHCTNRAGSCRSLIYLLY